MFKVGLELLEMSLNRLGKQKSRYNKKLPVGAFSPVVRTSSLFLRTSGTVAATVPDFPPIPKNGPTTLFQVPNDPQR